MMINESGNVSFKGLAAGVAFLLLVLVAGCAGEVEPVAPGPLMVAGFENRTGNDGLRSWDPWLADMLIRDLWQSESPVVWPLGRSLRVRRDASGGDREAILESARQSGAGAVLFGWVEGGEEGLGLFADLLVLDGGEPQRLEATAATPLDLPAAVDRLRDATWAALGAPRPETVQSVTDITTANLEAYGLFIAGEVQFQRKSYMAAEQSFRKAAERDSLFAQAHYRRATARMRFVVSEQDDEARSAITLAWARREKAGVRDQLAIEALRDLAFGETATAAERYAELRARFPGDREQAYFHGLSLSRRGDLAAAEAAFAAATAADPRFTQALLALANTAFMRGQVERSLAIARQGLVVNPVDPGLLDAAITAALFLGELDEAEQLLAQAPNPMTYPALALGQANLLLLRGEVDAALELYLTLRSPFSIATAEIYAGRVNAALSRLSDTSQIQIAGGNSSTAAVALWFTAMVLEANGAPDMAFEELTKAVNLAPDFPDAMAAMGVLAARSGEVERATQTLATLRQWGEQVEPLRWRRQALHLEGELDLAQGDSGAAVTRLQEALDMAGIRLLGGGLISDRPLMAHALGRAYLAEGDLDASRAAFRSITEMSGERLYWPWLWLDAHVQLAELAMREGDEAAASSWAAVVRDYWSGKQEDRQQVVDSRLARLDRILPPR